MKNKEQLILGKLYYFVLLHPHQAIALYFKKDLNKGNLIFKLTQKESFLLLEICENLGYHLNTKIKILFKEKIFYALIDKNHIHLLIETSD